VGGLARYFRGDLDSRCRGADHVARSMLSAVPTRGKSIFSAARSLFLDLVIVGHEPDPALGCETGSRVEARMMSYLWHLFLAFCAGVACYYILTNPVAEYPIFSDEDSYVQMWKRTRQ
jgi:hypothetical protein